MGIKRVEVLYSGNVQGVGFRFTAEDLANKYGIAGYVRNLPDGKVEVVGEGEEDDLKVFLNKIDKMMGSYIGKKVVSWPPANGEFDSFGIRF